MKKIMRYFMLFIGCLLIAYSYVFIINPNNLVTFGFMGIGTLINKIFDIFSPGVYILMIDIIFMLITVIFTSKERIKKYFIPSLLTALLIIILEYIGKQAFANILYIEFPELVLAIVTGSALSGIGFGLVYKNGFQAGLEFLFEELIGDLVNFHSNLYTWIIDLFVIIGTFNIFGYQVALYSIIVIYVIKYMVTKARFGINDSKMFYVITTKEKEVKEYIMHDLKYELTVLDVKGGYSKKQNRILLAVIRGSDYYKLKEGIKIIDPSAFIAITDTYDVVNRKRFK